MTTRSAAKGTAAVLLLLCAAQFVMTIDSTVMNVSIASLVHDLSTSVTAIQLAVTLFTLVMATTMIAGGKIGDILGRRRTFGIGLVIYAMGSGITAIASNVIMLYVGWSLLEGLGAALILPTLAALVASNFPGERRPAAYAAIASAASAAMTLGPLIGGWVTTSFTWRYVFAAEVIVCIGILVASRVIADAPREGSRPSFDGVGALLSAGAMGAIVIAALGSSAWGWVVAAEGQPALFGISLTMWLILAGVLSAMGFVGWSKRREERGQAPLVSAGLFANKQLLGGLFMLTMQTLIMAGTLFALPLFFSVAMGLTAFQTGLTLMPMSIGLIASALWVSQLLIRRGWGPRAIVRAGLWTVFVATLLLIAAIDIEATSRAMIAPLFVMGAGIGLLAGQLGNVIQSAVPVERANEAGGLQYTAQNLGSSLGTAVIGSLLVAGLTSSIVAQVQAAPGFTQLQKDKASVAISENIEFVSDAQLKSGLSKTKATPKQQAELLAINAEGRVDALRNGLATVTLLTVITLAFTRVLPKKLD
ncbi:MAG TPA: MFS transporter [Coriobacteriia bacterium]|nr:MFS transporter [Coriobacteriia bacterium]